MFIYLTFYFKNLKLFILYTLLIIIHHVIPFFIPLYYLEY